MALGVVFLAIVGMFLHTALSTSGGAIAPDVASSDGAQTQAQQGNGVGGGNAANQTAGGPPPPVQRLLTEMRGRLQKNPKDASALAALGSLYFEAGMFARAEPYFVRTLALEPDNVQTRTNYAVALHNEHHDDAALTQLDKVLAGHPRDIEALYDEGIIAAGIGRREQARKAFETFVHVAPEDGRVASAEAALAQLGG